MVSRVASDLRDLAFAAALAFGMALGRAISKVGRCQPEHQGSKLIVWALLVVVRSAMTTR